MTTEKNIALTLSSGGARGLAHIGVIQELECRGYSITSIAGSSMGALVGGLLASGTLNNYAHWVTLLNKKNIFGLMDFTLDSKGILRGEKVFAEMRKKGIIPDVNIEDLPVPLAIVATDIIHNNEVVFTSGDLYKAIRASIAVPNIFTPVKHNQGLLIDGGVVNPLPINRLHKSNSQLVVAIDVNANVPYSKPIIPAKTKQEQKKQNEQIKLIMKKWNELKLKFGDNENKKTSRDPVQKIGYLDISTKAIQLMQEKITRYTIEKEIPDLLIEISRDACSVFEFYKAEELIAAGREACARALDTKLL
jgi:NTE family protein